MPTVDLSQPGKSARVVNLSVPAESRGERITRGLATVALVAGTIAAGAAAAHGYATASNPAPRGRGKGGQ